MAVVFDAVGSSNGVSSSTQSIDFTNITVGSGSNRALVVMLTLRAPGTDEPDGAPPILDMESDEKER
jgi:hypothetical protein